MATICSQVCRTLASNWGLKLLFSPSLNMLQLELFCKREEKWDGIPYVLVFMLLYQNKPIQMKSKIMTQHAGKPDKAYKNPRRIKTSCYYLLPQLNVSAAVAIPLPCGNDIAAAPAPLLWLQEVLRPAQEWFPHHTHPAGYPLRLGVHSRREWCQ